MTHLIVKKIVKFTLNIFAIRIPTENLRYFDETFNVFVFLSKDKTQLITCIPRNIRHFTKKYTR